MKSESKGDLIFVVGREVREVILREKPFGILHARKNSLMQYSSYNANNLRVIGFKTKTRENLLY